jgi:8-oxo-dGTP pyrophosphatase MutT (NUDIX family)
MIESNREFGESVAGAYYVDRPGGYAVIFNVAGEVAVVSTPQGLFLPGGGQDRSETSRQAAVREANEECGLSIRLGKRLGAADELVFAEEKTCTTGNAAPSSSAKSCGVKVSARPITS